MEAMPLQLLATVVKQGTLFSLQSWKAWGLRAASIKRKSLGLSSRFNGFPRKQSAIKLANDSDYGLQTPFGHKTLRKRTA